MLRRLSLKLVLGVRHFVLSKYKRGLCMCLVQLILTPEILLVGDWEILILLVL